MRDVSQLEWLELISKDSAAVIIDARTPAEWAEGSLENAILMDVLEPETFYNTATQLDSSKNYYVYCRSGKRSVTACEILEAEGNKNTFNLLGGWLAWTGPKVIPNL